MKQKETHLVIPAELKAQIEAACVKHIQKTKQLIKWQDFARWVLVKHCKKA
jgi:hypothetical protein